MLLLLIGAGIGYYIPRRRARVHSTKLSELPNAQRADNVLQDGLAWVCSMSGARRAVVWRLATAENQTLPIAAHGGARPAPQPLAGDPLTWVQKQNVPVRVSPAPVWADGEVIALPAAYHDDVVLTLELNVAPPAAPEQFSVLGLYLGALMSVHEARDLVSSEHERVHELIATLRTLPTALDVNELTQQLARAACKLTGSDGAAVIAWEQDRGTVMAVEGDGPAVGDSFGPLESETALAARAHTTLVRPPGTLGKLPLVASTERFRQRPAALAAVPLRSLGEVAGVLVVWSRARISEHALFDLETVAPYAALQMRHAHEFGAMRNLAERDALTGLHNRHAFDVYFRSEAARFDRYQRPFAVVILDIDHFKTVNDRYGHEAGDHVLTRVSEVIAGSLRSVDFAARMGGEEFVVVLPETGVTDAVEIAERIRARVEVLEVQWLGQHIEVGISAGVSACAECVADPKRLLRSADSALYASKNGGRNRVTAAPAAG